MSALIFRLRNVPEAEASAVRSLLDKNKIDWYETTAGNWGIAMPGLWVRDTEDLPAARQLIDNYQATLSADQRAAFEASRAAGNAPTLLHRLQARPLATIGIIVFCLFILYVSINPFLQLIGATR